MSQCARISRITVPLLIATLVAWAGSAVTAAADVELNFAMWIVEAAEIQPTLEIIAAYEAAHPGVKINLIHQPWSGYHDKIVTQAVSGQAPDVMAVSRLYLPAFAEAGFLLPLTDAILPLADEIVELASGTYKGEVYGIPIWGGPALWMYNGTLFDEAGLARPNEVYLSGGWTWDTVVEMGKKITRDTNGDGVKDIWMLESPSTWVPDWVAKVHQFGGRVVNVDRTKAMIDQPEAVQALTFWIDLDRVYGIAPAWTERQGVELGRGNLAIYGRYASESVTAAKVNAHLDLGLVPQPAGPAGSFHIAGGVPLAVSSATKYPKEATEFAIWYALYSDQWKLRGIPANRDALVYEYLGMVGEYLDFPEAIVYAMSGPYEMEPSVGYTEFVSVWDHYLHQLRMGNISPEEAASQIAAQLNLIMSERQR